MRKIEPTEWVVYKAATERNLGGHNAVCSQQEWDELVKTLPGVHTLIREHIRNEAEAEQLARTLQTVPPVPKVVKPNAQTIRKQAERAARILAANSLANTQTPTAEPEKSETDSN
jgi:hypothetical protein